ncbi:putative transposase, MuDR, plant [Plasmopara halstedii]
MQMQLYYHLNLSVTSKHHKAVVNIFHSGEHTCKDDIISAVIDYHAAIYRPFRVAKSDQRRYKAICKNEGCPFEVQFSFCSSFQSPTKFVPHECRVTECDTLSHAMNRSWTAKQLIRNPAVKQLYMEHGREVIKTFSAALGLSIDFLMHFRRFLLKD